MSENKHEAMRLAVAAIGALGIAGLLLYILWAFPWWELIKVALLVILLGGLVALVVGMIRPETFHGLMALWNMEPDDIMEAARRASSGEANEE